MNTSNGNCAGPSRRAFSLIELLAVIGIIAIVIAIIVPALSSARDSAKKQETVSLSNQITQACLSFQQSEGRLPGYFPPRVMGDAQNATRGFTMMQNVMLDLMGGISTNATAQAGEMEVGPTATDVVVLAPDSVGLVGSGPAYLSAATKYFREAGLNSARGATSAAYAWTSNEGLARQKGKEMYDAFGSPLAIWVVDDSQRGDVTATTMAANTFAQLASPATAAQPSARFYWNSNAALFTDAIFSYSGVRQDVSANLNDPSAQSLLGARIAADSRRATLMGLAGNPASPQAVVDAAGTAIPTNQILPSAARGQVIVHSAGRDRIFLSTRDRGGKRAVGAGAMYYGLSFPTGGGKSSDIVAEFDDIVMPGG
jgi:prepilin-type N-terminal cleavage/methylation domain-containing protein